MTQPEALRLADMLENNYPLEPEAEEAAAGLRRLHEENEQLRQALAQPEQRGHCTFGDPEALGVVHFRTRPCFHYTEPLAQPEQEPVAWVDITDEGKWSVRFAVPALSLPDGTKFYTAPPKREWVGLTRRELDIATLGLEDLSDCYKAIEAKLKEKNT